MTPRTSSATCPHARTISARSSPVSQSIGNSIYVLNAVGSRIWDLLRSPTTPNRIADVVADEFDVSLQVAAADVLEFIDALGARGLVQPADNG